MLKRLQTASGTTTVISTPPPQTTSSQFNCCCCCWMLLDVDVAAAAVLLLQLLLLLPFCCRTSLLYYLLTKLPCCLHQHPASSREAQITTQANGNFDLALIKQSPSQISSVRLSVCEQGNENIFGIYQLDLIATWH